MRRSTLPLFGVKVIDFGQYVAGPAVAMILADLGATVVHIDPPSGPLWDGPPNATLNRNKLIVQIDLKTGEGVSQAQALIREADIVIENFRRGVLRCLGIDFKALRKARPDLITVSIPGFASNDQLRREWRAFEAVIEASSGVFTSGILGGLSRVLMGANRSFSPLPLASAYGAILAASATVLALQARERSGTGDQIEMPLACALTEGLAYNSISVDDLPAAINQHPRTNSADDAKQVCRWISPTTPSRSCSIHLAAIINARTGACSMSSARDTSITPSAACRFWGFTTNSSPKGFLWKLTHFFLSANGNLTTPLALFPAKILGRQDRRKDENRLPDPNCKGVGTDLRRRPRTRRAAPMA